MSKRPKPRDVPGTAGTRVTSTGRMRPWPQIRCERCGDRFAGQAEYEAHAQIRSVDRPLLDRLPGWLTSRGRSWHWSERGDCLTHEQRRALATVGGDPYPMTQDAAGAWSFPPNPPELQAGLEELIDDCQAGHALEAAVDEAMRLPLRVRMAMRLPRWLRAAMFPLSYLQWRRQRQATRP